MRVEYGFSTRAREAAKITGMSYADIVAAQAKEKELAAKSGLLHGNAMNGTAKVAAAALEVRPGRARRAKADV